MKEKEERLPRLVNGSDMSAMLHARVRYFYIVISLAAAFP